jgi:quinoprotein glucose dehydrogenase
VTLADASPQHYPGELTLDSPPAVLDDTLIVGSAIDDMTRADTPGAAVRALDVRTGALLWQFDPSPADAGSRLGGGGNVWAPIAADAASGMVFLPTASPSAAFFGGERPGEDLSSSAVVALDGATGKLVWRFQTTHHDIWDYDVTAQPTLATIRRDGHDLPVVVATKMGFVFVLDRATGRPVFPVGERPVPLSDVPGELLPRRSRSPRLRRLWSRSASVPTMPGASPSSIDSCAGSRSQSCALMGSTPRRAYAAASFSPSLAVA